ncbi:tRNA pseudouridine synthase 3, partial [Clonorchis sinensis]
YKKRRVAFQFAYLGWNYSGLAIQNFGVTVMQKLMDAFEKARLIEDRISCDFTVCGRTDKGVSALGQVVSLVVRSALVSGLGIVDDSGTAINERPSIPDVELDYVFLLNKLLPPDIRILAWSPVGADFSARYSVFFFYNCLRFTCCQRSYTYFIPCSGLDITMMAEAAKRLEGTHDFRNFCSINLEHELPVFVRRIDSVLVRLEDTSVMCDPTTMCEISITGSGFLYHQVRCIVALLVTIGRGYESPSLIDDLLDIEKTPAKPQYQMAADYPLILMGAEYPPGSLSWETSEAARFELVRHFQKLWSEHAIRYVCPLFNLAILRFFARARTSKVLLDHVEGSLHLNSSLISAGCRFVTNVLNVRGTRLAR